MTLRLLTISCSLAIGLTASASAQVTTPPAEPQSQTPPSGQYEPKVGQAGKDVVWVPSPESTVEKMLDVAKVTPQDFVVDLGSGDGRNVIAAAKRGARGLGVEFNPDMVELSKRNAQKAGVADRASFVQGDMYTAEFSQATVMALFLLPNNLLKLREKFAELKPGTRIVANTFGIEGWTAEETFEITDSCTSWCTVLLYFVPAKFDGAWQTAQGVLTLKQEYQAVTGMLGDAAIENGRIRGENIRFTVGGRQYEGKLSGDTITGTAKGAGADGAWQAKRSAK